MTPHTEADLDLMDVKELEGLVVHLATLYDQGLPCVDFDADPITDPHYDTLVRVLRRRAPDCEAFAKGTTSPSAYDPSGDLVTHNPPMTSIAKADGDLEQKKATLKKWRTDCMTRLGVKSLKVCRSFKHDGVAVRIYYEKGKLVRAGLRPRNGVKGIDVTKNIVYVKGVPDTLPLPLTLAIGGELECLLDDFTAVNKALELAGEELRKNPRNHTYGGINQKTDPTKTKDAKISFTGYNITGFDNSEDYYTSEIERAKWCNQVLKVPFVRATPLAEDEAEAVQQLLDMEKMVPDLQYEVDGVVLKVNNLEDQEQLGNTGDDPTGDPRGALAWKFEEEFAIAEVKEVEYSASRTGRVPPVAIFKQGVKLAGTTVTRATLNNIGWMSRMRIGVGTKVKVIKAGKIIPKVIDVISGQVDGQQWPLYCPTCGTGLKKVEGTPPNVDLICPSTDCMAKHGASIVFYLRMIEAKGLGESAVEHLLNKGKLKGGLADLYTLKESDLTDAEFSEREALLALATIHMVKPQKDNDKLRLALSRAPKPKVQAWQFFAALGLPGAGKTAGKALVEHLKSFAKILNASVDDLLAVPGIGQTTAEAIHAYFKTNGDKIRALLGHVELEYPKTGKLTGQSFCLSGSFDDGKSHWEKAIAEEGGKISSGVTKTTSFLVAGPGSGSKSDKARELGVKIIDVEELKKML